MNRGERICLFNFGSIKWKMRNFRDALNKPEGFLEWNSEGCMRTIWVHDERFNSVRKYSKEREKVNWQSAIILHWNFVVILSKILRRNQYFLKYAPLLIFMVQSWRKKAFRLQTWINIQFIAKFKMFWLLLQVLISVKTIFYSFIFLFSESDFFKFEGCNKLWNCSLMVFNTLIPDKIIEVNVTYIVHDWCEANT